MNFDFDYIVSTEFGVAERIRGNVDFYSVPVDRGVEVKLHEMAVSTWEAMLQVSEDPFDYEVSNEAAVKSHLQLRFDNPIAELYQSISQAGQFQPGGQILQSPRRVFCYFARLTDGHGRQVTGMRRSTGFKGVLSPKLFPVALFNDSLRSVEDNLFRLDADFDLLIDSDEVRVLHPAGMESISQLRKYLMGAAPMNIAMVRESLEFVDFDALEEVIERIAPRSVGVARILSSINTRGTEGITIDSLQAECVEKGVGFSLEGDRVTIDEQSVMDFLYVLVLSQTCFRWWCESVTDRAMLVGRQC